MSAPSSTSAHPATPTLVLATVFAILGSAPLHAQDGAPRGWSDVAELTFVFTGGNASSSTLGIKNTFDYAWANAAFQVAAGAVRTESGIATRIATGTPDDFVVTEDTDTELTAEAYFIKTRYDRTVGSDVFVFGGAGWDRNTFAGIQNRFSFVGGAGHTWFNNEEHRLKTDLGATYTVQDDVTEDPNAADAFLGLRASVDFFAKLTTTTDFTSVLVVDESLDETSDVRADWTGSISVAMSTRLALKTSLQVLWDNDPALVAVPLGATQVLAPLKKTDRTLTLAIVAKF